MMISSSRVARREVCRRLFATNRQTNKQPIIACKRPEFDHYEGQTYNKFDGIKLASQSWLHPKSKNDYFTIYLNANKTGETNRTTNEPNEESKHSLSFQDIGISPKIAEVLVKQGFSKPTPIQAKGVRSILKGNNTVITAETGCGKTLAYLLPIIHNIIEWKATIKGDNFNSPLAVIIAPSRELTKQIGYVTKELCKYFDIDVTTIVGGHTKRTITNPPVEYCDIIVTTLGAFSKLVSTGIYKTHNTHHVVLDEADTLLDDSFREKLAHLLKKFAIQYHTAPVLPPKGCQLTLVSATMPRELPEQVNSFVDPESLNFVSTANIHRLLPHVPQKFKRVGKAQKSLEILKLVTADVNMKRPVMIFSNKADTCDWLSLFLNESNIKCVNLHGAMNASLQLGIFDEYRSGRVDVISCTDITSRGLDTLRTQHIINYDFPLYMADYIHRCGRTGRLGGPPNCSVTNLIAWPREMALVQKIEISVRKHEELPNVNANIRKLINERINNFAMKDLKRLEKAMG